MVGFQRFAEFQIQRFGLQISQAIISWISEFRLFLHGANKEPTTQAHHHHRLYYINYQVTVQST